VDEQTKWEKPNTTNVGYGNPPKHTRFKKGQSGNSRGRPPGSLNLATVLARTLREKVVINYKNGRHKVMTKLELAITKLVDNAAAGDGHAIRYLCQLVISAEERSGAVEPTIPFSETDQKIMDNIIKRFQQSLKEDNDDPEQK
jgi:hypothetical protein